MPEDPPPTPPQVTTPLHPDHAEGDPSPNEPLSFRELLGRGATVFAAFSARYPARFRELEEATSAAYRAGRTPPRLAPSGPDGPRPQDVATFRALADLGASAMAKFRQSYPDDYRRLWELHSASGRR